MIRHGREAIDRRDLATLHARGATPWSQPGHPDPINLDPLASSARSRVAPRTYLYDADQARAFAVGEPIPALPEVDHCEDLLTERDAARYLTAEYEHPLREFRDRVKSLRIPPADEKVFGVNHWYRRTLDDCRALVAPGAASGDARRDRAARTRMKAVLAARESATLGITELARRADVSLSSARAFLREPRLSVTITWADPVGPGMDTWRGFLDAVRELASGDAYEALTLVVTEK